MEQKCNSKPLTLTSTIQFSEKKLMQQISVALKDLINLQVF